MAEFKTAEQYVVEKLEATESELEGIKKDYEAEIARNANLVKALKEELDDAYTLLNIFRDFISVSKDVYWGNVINVESIYGKEYPEEVDLLMEYFDMRPEEDETDE